MKVTSQTKKISLLSLVMLTVVSVDSIRNLPAAAKFGEILITFYILAAIFFLIPTALVSAELAAKFKCSGGIYTWVKEAYGDKAALFAIWLQWIENVIWYPTIISFIVGALAYVVSPEIINNKYYLASSIIIVFWLLTFLNLKGMTASAAFSDFCSIAGLILPMLLIIYLGFEWLLKGGELAIKFSLKGLIPTFDSSQMWLSLTAIMLSFSGVEIVTVHADNVDNPQKKFPKALAYAALIILFTLILGSLSIAMVLPESQINLITGIIQAFEIFFKTHDMLWCLPIIAITLAIGATGTVSNWIIAPTKGLYFAAEDGNLPVIFKRKNENGSPTTLLYAQAAIVSIISLTFVFIPDVNQSYWILTVIATQLYMLMYIIMFITFLKLRKHDSNSKGYFRVPFGGIGAYITAFLGLTGCAITFFISFIPPEAMFYGSNLHYATKLSIAIVLLAIPPFLFKKKNR